jgi:hypothetical protein
VAIASTKLGRLNGTTDGWCAKGLIPVSNSLYLVLLDTATTKIRVYKSTFGGAFAEQDSADAPTHSGVNDSYDASTPLTLNGFIYVAYRTAVNTVRVRRFNTGTDQWETADVGAANATTAAHATFNIRVGVRSDGDVLLVYRDLSTSDVFWTRYEGSSWAAGAAVLAGTYAPLDLLMTDNSDMAHVFGYDTAANDHTQRSISNANALGTEGDLDATASLTINSVAGYVNDSGTHRIAQAVKDADVAYDFQYSTSGTAPAWTNVAAMSPTTVTNPSVIGGTVVAHDPGDGLNWYVIWAGAGRGQIHMDVSDDLASPAFTTDTNVITGLGNDPPCYAASAATGIAVAYTDPTTGASDVVWAVGAPPAAPGLAIPVFTQRRIMPHKRI